MDYNFREIEKKWSEFWKKNNTYRTEIDKSKSKYYGLTMFPYPSGTGLHVGHPLGYIASDIYARYKKLKGFSVLHPMGYDSFGLPAEQYAIETGQHPAITTEKNLKRYREQLDLLGFSFDWDREIRTSDPDYYKWTQWIFKLIFNSYYCKDTDKALAIQQLTTIFEKEGNKKVNAATDCEIIFSADEWKKFSEKQKSDILMEYRLVYLADTWVNWCPDLGTVLANDEVVNGVSERGGFPVERKLMRQWSMRITAYADRLLQGLNKLDWSEAVKEIQRNWIGKSEGAAVKFKISEFENEYIEVFTTRPDTIFGVSFMVLSPEHNLVDLITTPEYKTPVDKYKEKSKAKSERERLTNKTVSGQFTGAFAIHPFSGEKIPVWIGDYVLSGYGTGAVMAVPCGDQRDWNFADKFNIPIKNIFKDIDVSEAAYSEKEGVIENSEFLNGLSISSAIEMAIEELEHQKIGERQINFRLRDAVFSRQRYWGEPFPIYYENGIAKTIDDECLPVILPDVDNYLPTKDGRPPLGNAESWYWDTNKNELTSKKKLGEKGVFPMELNTMPGWAGSSWYFLRYMDPNNSKEFADEEKINYWNQVDLYIGGAEHATGHLLYARFWSMFLHDLGLIPFEDPFQKMINQGMILGRSNYVYRDNKSGKFISLNKINEYETTKIHVDINLVDSDVLNIEAFKKWRAEYVNAKFVLEDNGTYICGHEVEKMSKSKYNVQNPDELIEKFGADTLRMYEMFLGPIEQAKPWDTKGINGVSNFIRKLWRLFHDEQGNAAVSTEKPNAQELKSLHKLIKKITDDMERYVFNTAVSAMMISVNELTELKCNKKDVLEPLTILISPYAPFIAEELWEILGNASGTVYNANFPEFEEAYLLENEFEYPVSFNGKKRFTATFSNDLPKEDIEKLILKMEKTLKYLDGKTPKKIIVVPKRIINIVM